MSGNSGPRTYKAPPTFVTPGNLSFGLYNPNEEWDASAWFQALTTVRGPPGAKTSYDEARPRGFHADTDPNDFTSFIFGQAEITEYHWPDVMFLLRPPPEREAYLTKAAPGQLHDSQGLPMVEKWPIEGRQARPLKELAGLPDNVSKPVCSIVTTLMGLDLVERNVGPDRILAAVESSHSHGRYPNEDAS